MPAHRADVELRLPADGAYASVLRTTVASLAARLDFTIDDIDDLRILVGEVTALVIPEARAGSDLLSHVFLAPGRLEVQVAVETEGTYELDQDSFAWQVLTTLSEETSTDIEAGRLAVTVAMSSSLSAGAGA